MTDPTLSDTARRYTAQEIPLTLIQPGRYQPRKRFDEATMQELTDSIRTHGVQMPIVVRPIEAAKAGAPQYEIVAGERRWRACNRISDEIATAAGGTREAPGHSIPAFVRELDDFAAAEIALIENTEREDLDPLEEAEAFEALLLRRPGGEEFDPPRTRGYTVEQLAEKIGHKPNFVYGRLKLLQLVPDARAALIDGRLQPKLAEALARYASDEQARALAGLLQGWGGEPFSHRQGMQYLRQHFGLVIRVAPFEITDPELIPEAGPCTTCMKRSRANPDLFGEDGDDLCLDGACHHAKVEANRQALLAKAAKQGLQVVTGKALGKLFGNGVTRLADHTLSARGYMNLDHAAEHLTGTKKKLRALLGTELPTGTKVAMASEDPAPVTVAPVDQVKAALDAKGLLKPPTKSSDFSLRPSRSARPLDADGIRAQRAERLEELLNRRFPMLFAKHLESDGGQGLPESSTWLYAIAEVVIDQCGADWDTLREACGAGAIAGRDWVRELDEAGKAVAIMVALLSGRLYDEHYSPQRDRLTTENDSLARELGFDLAALREQAGAEIDEAILQEIDALEQPKVTPETALAAAVKKAHSKKPKAKKPTTEPAAEPEDKAPAEAQEADA